MKHFTLILSILALVAGGNLDAAPIHLAARIGSKYIIQSELDKGVSAKLADEHGNTPLHYTSSARIAQFLLDKGADPSAKNNESLSPLHMVPLKLSLKEQITGNLAQTLIRGGADVNATDDGGNTPLHDAARFGWVKMIELLIEHKANTNAKNTEGHTPLHASVAFIQSTPAARARNAALGIGGAAAAGTTHFLVSRSLAKIELQGATKAAEAAQSDAYYAAEKQYPKRMVEQELKPHETRRIARLRQQFAVSEAIKGADSSEVIEAKKAWAKSAKPKMVLDQEQEALRKKAEKSARKVYRKQIKEAKAIAKKSTKLSKVVAVAAIVIAAIILTIVSVDTIKRHLTLQKLIDGGANVNALDADGNTPLHLMAAGKRFKFGERKLGIIAAHKLLDAGANYNATNKAGLTPYQIARRNYRLLLAAVLKPSVAARRQKRKKRSAWIKEKVKGKFAR